MKPEKPKQKRQKPEKSLSDMGYIVDLKCDDSPLINLSVEVTQKAEILDFEGED